MSTSFTGNSDSTMPGFCPPPPPPPPVPGQVPALRINTVEPSTIRRPQNNINDPYEPPAAIQNAMMTKDKKPFTYTPGMGGKLDLSQIRSPRMARRVAKNANDEGIEGPPKSALDAKPSPPVNSTTGATLFVQPQVAVPVFPTNIPVPTVNKTVNNSLPNRVPSNASDRQQKQQPEVTKQQQPVTRVETKIVPVTNSQPSSPDTPSTPTQVTLAKAPTPWLQNKNKPQEELPEWAKRSNANKSLTSSPDSPSSPPVYNTAQQQQQQQPQRVAQTSQQVPQQQIIKRQVPNSQQQQQQERVVPIRIEDRPSVFAAKHEPGHHQFKQPPSSHHQQRWGQQQQQQQQQVPTPTQVFSPQQNQFQSQQSYHPNQSQQAVPQPQPSGGGYIIPVVVEGNSKPSGSYVQQPVRNAGNVQRTTTAPVPQQFEPGPLQSRSFRVLQKITDTDNPNDVDPEQLRKLQLTEDDRILMNKFKEQVDGDTYLHQEEDPRYRGAAIPSRAFRYLQNMTDSGNVSSVSNTVQRNTNANPVKKQNRNSKSFEEMQANLPPSEQQVPEPKKYTGSAIPSRSFRILQAMTAPESIATQENGQADDNTCNSETNVTSNQHQGTFYSAIPTSQPLLSSPSSSSSLQSLQPYWTHPSENFWCYYPYQNPMELPYVYYNTNDGKTYACYPIYNHNNYEDYENSANFENNQANNHNNNSNDNINPWEFYPQYLSSTSNSNINNNNHDDGGDNDNNYNNNNNSNSPNQNFENRAKPEPNVDMGLSVPNYWNLYPQFHMNSHPFLNNYQNSEGRAESAIRSNLSADLHGRENTEFTGMAVNDENVGIVGSKGHPESSLTPSNLEPNYLEPQWNRPKSLPKVGNYLPKLYPDSLNSNMNIKFEEANLGEAFSKGTETVAMTVDKSKESVSGNESSKELNICPKETRRPQDRRLSCSRTKLKKDAKERKLCEAGIHISVDNYTYESCSDSESSSSSDSIAQGSEGTTEKSCNFSSIMSENDVSDSEMESDDSYLVFSTDLNGDLRDAKQSLSVSNTTEDNEATSCLDNNEEMGVEKRKTEDEGNRRRAEPEEESDDEEDDDETLPKQLSTVFEDSVISRSCSNNATGESWNDEALDDSTTVSVSLPLRLQFSVSENNEDVTTVIVGDSTVKEEKIVEKDSEVNVNFTLKKRCNRKDSEEQLKKVEEKQDEPPPDVNFILQKNTGCVNLIECETEFTIRRVVKKPKNSGNLAGEGCEERMKWNMNEEADENRRGNSPNGESMEGSEDFESIWDQRLDNDGTGRVADWNNDEQVENKEEEEKTASQEQNSEFEGSSEEDRDPDDGKNGSEDQDDDKEVAAKERIDSESPKSPTNITEKVKNGQECGEICNEPHYNCTESVNGSISVEDHSNPRPGWVKRTRRIFENSECDSEEEQLRIRSRSERIPEETTGSQHLTVDCSVASDCQANWKPSGSDATAIDSEPEKEPESESQESFRRTGSVESEEMRIPAIEAEIKVEDTEDCPYKLTPKLLSVQNSREETDDEDSGVTSDISRIISEADTDNECSGKKVNKYQRTQTHSRLFRLLNNDSILEENVANHREHLTLPLNSYSYNYDENSNCSSGLTSPDYLPCEQTWRRFQDDSNSNPDYLQIQERLSNDKDSYFQTWKVSARSPSIEEDTRGRREPAPLGFGECRKPFWAYKTNVLCPRIKSSKNIPKALKS